MQRAEALAAEEEGILDHRARCEVGGMGELEAHADIAASKDPRIGRAEEVVDHDALGIVENARSAEV